MRTAHRLAEDLERVGAAPVARGYTASTSSISSTTCVITSRPRTPSRRSRSEINRDIDAVADSDSPPMDDEPFDRVQDWVIEWTQANPVPIPHRKVPDLEH